MMVTYLYDFVNDIMYDFIKKLNEVTVPFGF